MKSTWHLWVVGILGLIWNGMGAMDYVLTASRNENYLAQFTAERLAFLEALPFWVICTWALAIWLAVAGSFLLLLRSRFAQPAFLAGLVFLILTTIHNLWLAEVSAAETMNGGEMAFTGVIFVLAIAQWVYAKSMKRRGVLK